MMTGVGPGLAFVVAVLGAAACGPDTSATARMTTATLVDVRLAPGSAAGDVTFWVTAPPRVRSFRVVRPTPRSHGIQLWALLPITSSALSIDAAGALPHAVHYGIAPPGFTGTTPGPMGPGEYTVERVTGDDGERDERDERHLTLGCGCRRARCPVGCS